jgi:hypothetical protein
MLQAVQRVLRLLLPMLLGCMTVSGCRRDDPGGRPLAIVVSGDTAGWIVPCGCASNQSGGLPRRASYLREVRRQAEVIVADAGGAPAGTSLYDRTKFAFVLRGEADLGVAAHNVGGPEAALGVRALREIADQSGVRLISANACDPGGRPLFPTMHLAEAGGRRVALVGVLGEDYATDEIRVAPPRQAALDALRSAAGSYDLCVVLAYLPEDQLRLFAEALPEADLVVGGPTGQPVAPKRLGPTLLASATNKGKFLVRFDAPAASGGPWSGVTVELDDRFADDAQQVANVEAFRRALGEMDPGPEDTSFAAPLVGQPDDYRLGGTASCKECHADEADTWAKARHSHAWESLEAKGAEVDPDCQRCHATGYGLPGGFAGLRRTPERAGVGCECCHGPSQAHVAESDRPTAYFGQAAGQCTGCHDRENSPEFEFEAYWAKIRHGPTEPAEAAAEGGTP